MKAKILQPFKDFISLFYPEVCLVCGEGLNTQEEFVCTSCMFKLPKTGFHNQQDNLLHKGFWGRADIANAAAYCYYQKGNTVQDLVHELKYHGKKELGYYLGKAYGQELKDSPHFAIIDVIIPVPLHPRKLRRRGYNQSAYFAKGLAEAMGKPCIEDALIRVKDTDTQTRKTRFSRYESVKGIFQVNKKDELKDKHVLLADDIITTGATVEACYWPLSELLVASLSVASIGYTPAN